MTLEERLKQDGYEGIDPILFFGKKKDKEFYWMSNFSAHAVILPHPFLSAATPPDTYSTGEFRAYSTGEHRFQAMKATNVDEHEYVRNAQNPVEAKKRGREIELREGWGNSYGDLCWYVMYETIWAKVAQTPPLRTRLMETVGRPIYEDSPTDDIWGVRFQQDYRGKNLLGRCWMDVRNAIVDL